MMEAKDLKPHSDILSSIRIKKSSVPLHKLTHSSSPGYWTVSRLRPSNDYSNIAGFEWDNGGFTIKGKYSPSL